MTLFKKGQRVRVSALGVERSIGVKTNHVTSVAYTQGVVTRDQEQETDLVYVRPDGRSNSPAYAPEYWEPAEEEGPR